MDIVTHNGEGRLQQIDATALNHAAAAVTIVIA
ncbi:hypothetical protein RCH14_002855 [Massilia sp. MP_M2]